MPADAYADLDGDGNCDGDHEPAADGDHNADIYNSDKFADLYGDIYGHAYIDIYADIDLYADNTGEPEQHACNARKYGHNDLDAAGDRYKHTAGNGHIHARSGNNPDGNSRGNTYTISQPGKAGNR